MMKAHNERLIQQIRELATNFPVKKMLRLDCGDQYVIHPILERIYRDLYYLEQVSRAECSIVIEMLEELGADMSAPGCEATVPVSALFHLVKQLVEFPGAHICKHLAAADVLSFIEAHGGHVSRELAGAVVDAEDEQALRLLTAENK